MLFSASFPCQTARGCPERALKHGEQGFCPAWVHSGIAVRNVDSGEVEVAEGCYFQVIPKLMITLTSEACRTSEEVTRARELTPKLTAMAVGTLLQRAASQPEEEQRALPDG